MINDNVKRLIFRQLLPTDFLYDVLFFFSAVDIIKTGLDTVSWLVYKMTIEKHPMIRQLWSKPPRVVPEMWIRVDSYYEPNPRVCFRVQDKKGLALPNMAPNSKDIAAIQNVNVIFLNGMNESTFHQYDYFSSIGSRRLQKINDNLENRLEVQLLALLIRRVINS
jgi:hypothetical protein